MVFRAMQTRFLRSLNEEGEKNHHQRVCFLYLSYTFTLFEAQQITWLLLGVSFIAFSLTKKKELPLGDFINYAKSGEYFLFHAVISFHLLTTSLSCTILIFQHNNKKYCIYNNEIKSHRHHLLLVFFLMFIHAQSQSHCKKLTYWLSVINESN